MGVETLSPVSMGAEIASATVQPISLPAESAINFNFNPSIGGEVFPNTVNAPQIASENIFDLPIYRPSFGPEITTIVPEITANIMPPIKPPEFSAEIFSLHKPAEAYGSSFIESEAQLDIAEFSKAIENLQSFGFTKEEEQTWTEKLKMAFEEKSRVDTSVIPFMDTVGKVELEVETETDGYTEPQTKAKTQTETTGQPPAIPPSIEICAPGNGENAEPQKTKTSEWEMFALENQKQIAEDSLKKRVGVARDIVEEAAVNSEGLISAVEARIYKLDVPDIQESARIIKGELAIPPVSQLINLDLAAVADPENPTEVHKTIVQTLYSHAPTEKVEILKPQGTLEEEQLPKDAKELAKEGANVIALRKNHWVPLKKPVWKDPVEFDKKAA